MKEFKIEVPKGYEIDLENSNLSSGVIKFKEAEFKWPDSVAEIKGREWYIHYKGEACRSGLKSSTVVDMSSKERAEAILALMQLLELRDYVNQGWKPDWSDNTVKTVIKVYEGEPILGQNTSLHNPINFKDTQTAEKFLGKYRDLIEQAKDLI